jgi:tetratricopeptide (TPR) repeat protein
MVALLLVGIAGGCAAILAEAGFDSAVQAFERGDYAAAITRLEDMLRKGSDSARLRTLLGWSHYRTGNFGRARSEFDRSLSLDSRDPNAYYAHEGLGWLAYRSGDYDRALASFGEALRLAPGYHNALTGFGWAQLGKGDLVRAEASFNSALERAPHDGDARRGLGFVAYRRAEWTTAVGRLRAVLRDNDADNLTRSALAWSQYYANDDVAARALFEDLARREPGWADPLLGLGWIAERQGRSTEAKVRFRAAIDKSASYVATGAAGTAVRRLLETRPAWADLWRDLGWGLYHQRAFALAESEFMTLLRRHPDDADALRGLGFALYSLKRYQQAIAPLERSIALGRPLAPVRERVEIPGVTGLHEITSDATSTLAWTHYHAGNLVAALRHFRETTATHPDWPDAWTGLGWTLVKSGDRTAAEAAFRRGLSVQPGYADALAGLQSLGRRQ